MFSLNATLPVFLVMVIGWALGQKGFLPKQFCTVADKLVFKVTLHFIHDIGVIFWAYPLTWSISSLMFLHYLRHCTIPRVGGGAPHDMKDV